MKKIMALFLTLALVIGILPVTNIPIAFAEDAAVTSTSQDSSELWDWEAYGDGVQPTKYKGTQTDVYVPNKVEKNGTKYSVLKLGDNLFKDNTAINSVTLGEGITEIGASAFSGATNLVCIVTSQTLTTIGDSAFSGCTVFNSIILYDTVISIGTNVFKNCPKVIVYCNESSYSHAYAETNTISYILMNKDYNPEYVVINGITYYVADGEAIITSFDNSVIDVVIPSEVNGCPVTGLGDSFRESDIEKISLPSGVTSIDDYAFYGCGNLVSVDFFDGVTYIGKYAFYNCSNLLDIKIPHGVTNIYNYAFRYCASLKSIDIPDSVTSIGYGSFEYCKGITSIEIPEGVTEIGDDSFLGCTGLESIDISNTVTFIGRRAFYNCSKLQSIEIPDKVDSIRAETFYGCSNLTSISIPRSVTTIRERAFGGCSNLKQVHIMSISDWCRIQFASDTSNPLYYADLYIDGEVVYNVVIPNGVTEIKDYAFFGSNLTNVILPNSIISIGNSSFRSCGELIDIKIPNSVISIGSSAFQYCKNLTSIKIPDSVTSIGSYAFAGCSGLTDVKISNSITSIENGVFASCTNMASIEIPYGVITIGESAFFGCDNVTNIEIPYGVTSIGYHSFYSFPIQNIKIPATVEDIDVDAFAKDTKLIVEQNSYAHTFAHTNGFSYTIGVYEKYSKEGVTYVITIDGAVAISFDASVTDVVIPESVENYPVIRVGKVFQNSDIRSISLPNNIEIIENEAFKGCGNLTSITIGEGVTFIGDYAFSDCVSLSNVTFLKGVSVIRDYAFSNCNNLISINLLDGVTYIGNYAFINCTNLTGIEIPDGVVFIGEHAFFTSKFNTIKIPNSVDSMSRTSFSSQTILLVEEGSNAHTFAIENSLLYYISTKDETPELHTVDGVIYIIINGEANAVSFNNKVADVVVPSRIEGYPVTDIKEVFQETDIESISLPGSVLSIKAQAFLNCANLTDVVLAQGVTIIGDYAFKGCSSLANVSIPNSVTSIGTYAFVDCTNLSRVDITDISAWCSINFKYAGPTNPLYYGDLYINGQLGTDIEIPLGVTAIGNYAFYNYDSLTNISIPNSVSYIGNCAFEHCDKLTIVNIPNGVTEIGGAAFRDCKKLIQIELPNSLDKIRGSAFSGCPIINIEIPEGISLIDNYTFDRCKALKSITIPSSVTNIGYYAFRDCLSLENVYVEDLEAWCNVGFSVVDRSDPLYYGDLYLNGKLVTDIVIPNSIKTIKPKTFYYCKNVQSILIPSGVTIMYTDSFPTSAMLYVYENSYAHNFAEKNNLPYFIIQKTENPEISYGAGITGTAMYTDGTAVSGATVEILYDDGTVKESVTTDKTGAYSFTYAEVGRYTIRVTDTSGNTGSEVVSVKRMNVFDVFLAGETDVVIKKGYTVSGTVSPANATITLTDTDGNVIVSAKTTDGTYSITNVPNGTYILKAETENGTAVKEITVFNGDVSVDTITIASESATITGSVEVEDRELKHHKRNWVHITIYNEDGVAVDSQKSDKDGNYAFTNLPLGEYSIVAETSEMRPDKDKGFERPHKLTGYAYVNVTEVKTYSDINIVLYEENNYTAKISGKVTAKGETQDCEVILTNVFKHEIARYETGNNGKYTFKNIPEGLYFITAITKSDGMGFAVVVVHNGKVQGNTNITVNKQQKFYDREKKFNNDVPYCENPEEAIVYRVRIAEEKNYFDGLSEKEKKQHSKAYIERLNRLCEWISNSSYTTTGDVDGIIENVGTVISGDELASQEKIEFVLNISETSEYEIPDDGIKTGEEFEQQSINDTAGDKYIVKYYDISLSKNGKEISNVCKHTDTTGKLRITIEIPEEYRGHKHYSFVHMHNGEPTTLVDLDDDPNTVTFEIDKFSTFALMYSDVELTETSEYPATITYDETTGKITVSSSQAGMLYIATFDGARFVSVETDSVYAETPKEYDFKANQAAFVWDGMTPLSKRFTIDN